MEQAWRAAREFAHWRVGAQACVRHQRRPEWAEQRWRCYRAASRGTSGVQIQSLPTNHSLQLTGKAGVDPHKNVHIGDFLENEKKH